MQGTAFYNKISIPCKHGFIDLSTPVIMGILNVTPDSFFDGGKYNTEELILAQAHKMIHEGASIIDIGAESTRPGAVPVTTEEELKRLIPFIQLIRKHYPHILISADTHKAIVANAAIDVGADIINDISGGSDPGMFEVIASKKVPYILMHIQGTPTTMQKEPFYNDVTKEVIDFLKTRVEQLKKLGVDHIIVDPGFGFGKTVEHNFTLLKNLAEFKKLNCPLLVGLSRKSMVNKILGISSKDALNGTTTLNTLAIINGANILRVHDVKEAKEVIELTKHINK